MGLLFLDDEYTDVVREAFSLWTVTREEFEEIDRFQADVFSEWSDDLADQLFAYLGDYCKTRVIDGSDPGVAAFRFGWAIGILQERQRQGAFKALGWQE